jgi:sec-independent protein translocase protein TatB
MFDIGALELIVVGVVALLVLGPERLPKVARTAGLWIGRARRSFLSVKEEIDREIKAEELREILRKQAASNPLSSILEEDGSLKRTAPPSHSRPTSAAASSAASRGPGSTADTKDSTRPQANAAAGRDSDT